MSEGSWVCPPIVASAKVEADYKVMYMFKANASHKGEKNTLKFYNK